MSATQLPLKKTKIVCTIGPASADQDVLAAMIANGMNIARINFAHGTLAAHRQAIANVRAAAAAAGQRVAIFGDLPGPKMRIGALAQEPVHLERGQSFVLQADEIQGNKERVSMNFDRLADVVSPGDSIFLNDGFIELQVDDVKARAVHCTVLVGGELRSHKGVNFPGIDLGISAFTEQDHEFLRFAAQERLDAVSVSFVEGATDIQTVRQAARELGYTPFIIAKIERARACDQLEEILTEADAIMVARGDLGVEIPIEEIAAAQKRIITRANLKAVPVITATHMLESMIENSRPTRAEVTDVANAILDGTDCVMLSGESAIGHYPAETVEVMAAIATVTEGGRRSDTVANLLEAAQQSGQIQQIDLISLNIYLSRKVLDPTLIFVPSRSGGTARRISRFHLPIWVVAISESADACQRLQFSYGVYPDHLTEPVLNWQAFVRDWMRVINAEGERVLLIQGSGTLKMADSTRIDVIGLSSEE